MINLVRRQQTRGAGQDQKTLRRMLSGFTKPEQEFLRQEEDRATGEREGMPEIKLYRPTKAPKYEPEAWRDQLSNCYSYALNLREYGRAAPGRIKLFMPSFMDLESYSPRSHYNEVSEGVLIDGLEPIRKHGADPSKHHVVAVFCRVAGRIDFHAYVLHEGNFWSHLRVFKGDERRIIERASGLKMLMPAPTFSAVGLGYMRPVGYFKIPDKGIEYIPRLDATGKERKKLEGYLNFRRGSPLPLGLEPNN